MLVSECVLKKISNFYGTKALSYVNQKSESRDTSIVEKWLFTFSNNEQKVLYIKQYRKDYYSNYHDICIKEFEFAKRYETTFNGIDGFDVVIPIFVIPNSGILVSEEAPGLDLYNFSLSYYNQIFEKKILKKTYKLSGRGLRIFHEESLCSTSFDYKKFKDYVDVRLEKLMELGSELFDNNDVKVIRDFLNHIGEGVDNLPITNSWLHGDYIPPNLIFGNDTIHLLDFLQLKQGPILDEYCYFLVFCKVQDSFPNKSHWPMLAEEFIAGYGLRIEASDLPFAQLFYIKHLLNYLLRISYWFRSNDFGIIRSRYHTIKYKRLKKDILKHCSGTLPPFLDIE
jgi:tRNA A-37 threonylcarbamoyl transferase component Bud32